MAIGWIAGRERPVFGKKINFNIYILQELAAFMPDFRIVIKTLIGV